MKSNDIAFSISKNFWPELEDMTSVARVNGVINVITFLYSAPIALIGLIWLIFRTNINLIYSNFGLLLFFAGLMYLADRLSFFLIVDTGNGRYANSEGALDTLVLMTATLIFGPTAIWLAVLWSFFTYVTNRRQSTSKSDNWGNARTLSMSLATNTTGILISFWAYTQLGGQFPIRGLDSGVLLPAMTAMIIYFLLSLLIWLGFIGYVLLHREEFVQSGSAEPFLRLIILGIGFPNLTNPFAILGAGIYVEHGLLFLLFYMIGILSVALLTRQLSTIAESNRQRSRQLERLEALGLAIINSPPDASNLPQILEENIPPMFAGRVAIWVLDDQLLLKYPNEWSFDPAPVWGWLQSQVGIQTIEDKSPLPWDPAKFSGRSMVIAPIYDVEHEENIGGIYIELRSWIQTWNRKSMENLFPAVQALTTQIASALHQAEAYAQTLEYQKVTQELVLAGRIQASFLPNRMPDLPGWQLAVTLLPARATSGDFFDFIPLSDGALGILIADVADKGIGPALYMALSRTLIRTYAREYQQDPAAVIRATNLRILDDARASLFVTVFYGVLNPHTGKLVYVNAGHNPPYLFSSRESVFVDSLSKTGIPIGIYEDASWELQSVDIKPGDVLVLYTDGVTEAQNGNGDFFNEDLLIEAAEGHLGQPAHEVQIAILEAVQNFVGDSPQTDDITLMILGRDSNHIESG